uniref:Adhesion G protein-coupled receptor G4 n=1 Tax=Chinchilla lanigera TaxID=34839 RepID=A0A8C2UQH4_CHILA
DSSSYWIAFSYITNNPFLGRENIDLGLAGNHQQLILYNLGKTFYISYHLIPFQRHTVCLIWDGVKGRLELFLNKERILIVMDQPQNLMPNGTLVLGHFPKNAVGQIKNLVPRFTGSLYYFQLWDRILENEELMKCLGGNVVSWEEDVWLANKIIPTVDRRLRCFVSENMTIQERSTTLSQQVQLTTPSQVTGLKPQKTAYYSAVISKSMPIFATDYTTILYSNITLPPSETTATSKILRTSIAKTATSAADASSTSAAMTLPTQEIRRTTKIVEAMATKTFHPTTATNFLSTSGFTENSVAPKTSAIESQSVLMKTASLFSTIESTSMSTTSWPKQKSTDFTVPSISTSGQEFLVSTAAGTVPLSTGETSGKTTSIRTTSAFTPKSLLNSTAASVDSVFPRNQTVSTLATTDKEIAFTIHSVMPTETPSPLIAAETELPSTNFQNASSPHVEDAISTFMPQETSSTSLSPMTSFPITGTQSVQTGINAESSHTTFTLGITLAPPVTETTTSPTVTEPVHSQNTPSADDHMFTLISTISASTPKAFELGPTSLTAETAHWFSSKETTWSSRPDQTLLTSINATTVLTFVPNENVTSAFFANTTNTENSSTATNLITPLESSMESNAITSTDATGVRYTTTLSKLTSPWFANFSTISGTTSVTSLPEFKLTTLLKTVPIPTVAANELPSTPGETAVSPADIGSTLADIKLNFSTEDSTLGTIHLETDGTSAFGDTTALVPTSAATQRSSDAMTTKETTSHHLEGRSTIAVVSEISLFPTALEVTDESASVTVSPFPGAEKLTTSLDSKTATAEQEGSWLLTTLMKTTRKSSYNGTTEIFNLTHTYTAHRISETSEGHLALSPTPESTQMFPEPLHTFTTRITGTSTDRTAMSLSSTTLPLKTAATHMPITHMFSLPITVSPVTSMVVSGETKATTPITSKLAMDFSTSLPLDVSNLSLATMTSALVPPLSQTASMTSDIMLTETDSIHTTSEATVISTTMIPMAVPSQTETLVPLLRSPIPTTTKTKATFPSTSGDTVTPSAHTLVCSKLPADNIPIVSSTHVISTMSTPVATQPILQVQESSTSALSLPFTFSGGGDVASLAPGTTETVTVADTIPLHTSASKLTASVDVHTSHSSTYLNIPASTQLVTGISTLSSDKDQMTTSLGKTFRPMEVTEMSPSKNAFISSSQSTSSLEMTDAGFSETTKVSNPQTYSPSEIPLGTLTDENSLLSTMSNSTWVAPSLTSNKTVDVHVSEMPNSLGKITLPLQSLTKTSFLSPAKESTDALSVYTPRNVEMVVNSSSVTHQNVSFVDTTISRTTRTSNPELINTTLSQFSSLETQPEVTSITSSISESTQPFPKSLSPSTVGLSNSKSTVTSTNGITTNLSVPNAPTLLGETSLETAIPISQISSLPVGAPTFTSSKVSNPFTIIMAKSSRTPYPGCLQSPSVTPSGPVSEIASVPVSDSTFSPAAVSSDTSTTTESLSPATPRTTVTTTVVSSAFTTSEMTEVPSRITPTSISSPTEATFLSLKIIPHTTLAGAVTSDVDSTASLLLSSKNTEAVTILGILSGITNSSISTVSNGRATALTNAYSRIPVPETVLSSTPSANRHTSLNIQVSPSWTNFKSTPGLTESIEATTTYPSSNTGKISFTTSEEIPVLYSSWTPSSATTPFLTSLLYSPYGTEAKFSTPKISPTSQMVVFPIMGTRITSSNTQSLLMTSWNTHRAEDSQFPLATTTHMPTPNKMEAETPHFVPGSLSTFAASRTSLVSRDAMAASSNPTSGILPHLGISESPSLSTSVRAILTRWPDSKHTFEKTTTSGTTLPPNPSLIPKITTSPMLTWILSSLPSGSPLTTVSNVPHAATSSIVEVSKSTFPASDMIPTYTFTNFPKLPFATGSTVLTKITSTPTVGSTTIGSPTSLPISVKVTDNSLYSLTSPETTSRTAITDNSRTVFQPPSFSGMSVSPSAHDHTVSFGSMPLPSPTKMSAWSRSSATSAPPSLTLPKSTLDSLINVTTTTSTTTGPSFPFISTGVAQSSTAVVSSLISSSFKATWLDSTFSSLTTEVLTSPIAGESIEPGKCKADETPSQYKGTYKWLLTNPTETAQARCIKNEDGNATRICSINIQTGKSQWEKPRFKQCKLLQGLPDKIVDLANITVNDENADDVAEHILNLINESPPLDEEETRIIVSKVAEISKCDEISMNLTQIILQIISAVSEKQNDSTSNLHQVSNAILRIIERAGHKMEFSGRTANVTVSGLALAVLRVGHGFEGMAFSIHSYEDGTRPETKNVTKALTSYVVSASISDTSIQNLVDPVVITLQHIGGNRNYDQVHCAFWDFETNNGLGGWNSSGCKVKETNVNYTICQCDHLTHFGVLMDLSRSTVDPVNERILVIITYTGCGISSIFLGIAMVTYIAFYKLRKDYPSKILINLCTALLMLNLAFLINSWLSSVQNAGLCIAAAVALHYFLLVSLTWMGLEAVHMYFALVKVFNIYIPNYILKFCLVGWGVPAITVAVILSVRKDLYGTLSPTTLFCWIKDDSIFYVSVVAYFCLIFFGNLSMFCTVLAQLNSMKSQRQKTRRKMILRDLKGTLSLTFLLGLTWGFAFFAWGPVRIFFLYLFAICNTLCGVNVGYKQERVKKTFEHKLLTPSLKSTATSSSFKSLGSVQDTPSEICFSNGEKRCCVAYIYIPEILN